MNNCHLFHFKLREYFKKMKSLSCVRLCATPWTAAHQVSPSMGFSRQEHWSGLPFPSNAWKWKVKVKLLSRVWLFETPWTAAHQASPSMGFSRQEYWSGVPLPSPRSILLSIIKLMSSPCPPHLPNPHFQQHRISTCFANITIKGSMIFRVAKF